MEILRGYSNFGTSMMRLAGRLDGARAQGPSGDTQAAPRTQRHRRLRCEQVEELTTAYLAGAKAADLARQFGVHPDTVRAAVTAAGVRRWPRRLTDAEVNQAAEMRAHGASMREVGRRLEVSPETIKRALARRLMISVEPASVAANR